jgi:serine/threonine protein kinase
MPYSESDIKKQINAIERNICNLDAIPNEYSPQLKELLSSMLNRSSDKRPNCAQILETIDKIINASTIKEDPMNKDKVQKSNCSRCCLVIMSMLVFVGAIFLGLRHMGSKATMKCSDFEKHSNRI